MRIAFVTTMFVAPWGGSEELWAQAAHDALADGHEVHVFAFRWPEMPEPLAALEEAGARVHLRPRPLENLVRMGLLHFAMHAGEQPVPVALTAMRAIARVRPDVVCVSQGDLYSSVRENMALVRWLQSSGTPYVVVCHFANDNELFRSFDRPRARRLLGGARHVGFVAQGNRRTAERQLGVRLPAAVLLRNPVALADRSVVPWPSAQSPQLASVAKLAVYAKGQDVLLETLAGEPWRERDWRLNLYGDGEDRHELERLRAMYGLGDRVVFHGHVPDVGRTVWPANHLLVLASRAEGTPLALVEAMLCGRPAVATDVGGHREWIDEGASGWLAAAPAALGEALDRAWQARDRWPQMGRAAHAAAAARYEPEPGRRLLELLTG